MLPFQSNAEETNSIVFNAGENTEQLSETKNIIVTNNDTSSTLSILENDKEIYSKDLDLIMITGLDKIQVNGESYAVITYRHHGSSNALYFEVLKLNETGIASIFTSEVHERGTLDVVENEISFQYPKYEADDVMTEPSKIVTKSYTIADGAVTEGDEQEIPTNEPKASISSTNKYTNPSFEEINRILTEESLKAGVAPEIVKAIAFQESSWRQYWDVVPESIKKCKGDGDKLDWDGTNALLGYDCIGIGIMQISNHMYMDEGKEKDDYIERLKTDIRFNIQEGIKILKEKWNYHRTGIIPTINDNDPMVIENWYFAIMAYNGMKLGNNPVEHPYTAYQEKVFDRMRDYTQIDINPFPTQMLDPYETSSGQLRFETDNFEVLGPQHYSSQSLKKGDTAYTTATSLRLRDSANGEVIGSLSKGTKVTITGKYKGNNSSTSQYVWMPIRTSSGQTGWVSSSYLSSEDYIDVYRLKGDTRYETGVSISNHGWHWDQTDYVVIGRGDLPIDALTGSVLASELDAPLLLTESNKLTSSVERELDRLNPEFVYILGSTGAISSSVESELDKKFNTVKRITGDTRYGTARNVAKEIDSRQNVKEVFVATGDEKSSDALTIAPYAGEKNIPILLTNSKTLSEDVQRFINEAGVSKVTIIGGNVAVSQNVENQLKKIVGNSNVTRVKGDTRFGTSIAIINKYYTKSELESLFISQGMETADALTASPLAAKEASPILLTQSNKVPSEVNSWLKNQVKSKPDLYFLGGSKAISESVRSQLINLVK